MSPYLDEVAEGVIIRPMLTLTDAVDFFCSRGLAEKTRNDYRRLLHRFNKDFPRHTDVAKVTETDILRYLATRRHLSKGTQAWEETVLSSFFGALYKAQKIKRNPMEFVHRTRRPDPDSLDRKTVSSGEVVKMLEAATSWPERLCLAILVYLGPRRGAVARLRLKDYHEGRLRFLEKGGKTIWKRCPAELAALLDEAIDKGVISDPTFYLEAYPDGVPDGEFFLVPPEWRLKKRERDDRVIWRLVTKIASRAGVDAHTHSLRAAFADFCLDSDITGKALQLLMGHKNPQTTERYTRLYDQQRQMDQVLRLSWAGVASSAASAEAGSQAESRSAAGIPGKFGDTPGNDFETDNTLSSGFPQIAAGTLDESRGMGAGGFEPPLEESRGGKRAGTQSQLVDDLMPHVSDVDELVQRIQNIGGTGS